MKRFVTLAYWIDVEYPARRPDLATLVYFGLKGAVGGGALAHDTVFAYEPPPGVAYHIVAAIQPTNDAPFPIHVQALLGVERITEAETCGLCRHAAGEPHFAECTVDEALTAAGLKTREERDAARKRVAAWRGK